MSTMQVENKGLEWQERQRAELEFVASAYETNEAWWLYHDDAGASTCNHNDETSFSMGKVIRLFRRLSVTSSNASSLIGSLLPNLTAFVLECILPVGYPSCHGLHVVGITMEPTSCTLKVAYDAVPDLLKTCREAANDAASNNLEAIFEVFQCAENWTQEMWPHIVATSFELQGTSNKINSSLPPAAISSEKLFLGRRMIFSHHIISKVKRSDLRRLAADLDLTGIVKIGWPGLILIEGLERSCQDFYNSIRRWAWQYLVLCGETRDILHVDENWKRTWRRFDSFDETDDISVMADYCHHYDLSDLFRTSMKRHTDNSNCDALERTSAVINAASNRPKNCDHDNKQSSLYGALIHVDHMNNGRAYRKWLRRTSCEKGIRLLLIKNCIGSDIQTQAIPENGQYLIPTEKRPIILVALIGSRISVAGVLKLWRTQRVDVDSRGKPCLERKMTILHEGLLDIDPESVTALLQSTAILPPSTCATTLPMNETHASELINEDKSASSHIHTFSSEECLITTKESLMSWLARLGGSAWEEAFNDLFNVDIER